MKDKNDVLFDNVNTPQKENRDDIIKQSFKDAITFYTNKLGEDINDWSWGKVHTMTFRHWPLGSCGIPPVEMLFNDKTYPFGGDQFTVCEGGFTRGVSFEVNHGPSQRMIVDLGALDNSLMVNSSGQVENLWHPNRKDALPLWFNKEYYHLNFTSEKVKAAARHKLLLVP